MRQAPDDPFGERTGLRGRTRLSVLGGEFTVDSTDPTLLQLAVDAFGKLPKHRIAGTAHRFNVRLVLTGHKKTWKSATEPPRPALNAGNGLLCATVDAGNFAIVDVTMSRALVCVSKAMMRFPYHVRYELIEFAVLILASRAQSLVPLHAACVGLGETGLLLMGASGTGKSTLSLHALIGGMKLLSEDSAFLAIDDLRITGVPNYLYVDTNALKLLKPGAIVKQIRRSPTIRRRSGTRKFEVDVRKLGVEIAHTPMQLDATIFLAKRAAGRQPALRPLQRKDFVARLRREQPYASALPNWRDFEHRVLSLPSYELRRTEHPDIAVRELRALLGGTG